MSDDTHKTNTTKLGENQASNPTKYENFPRMCRLCLSLEKVKSFFDTTYRDISIPELVFDFTSLKVDPEDSLPQQLCTTCLNELIRCYNFRKQCIEAEQILIDVFDKYKRGNNNATNEESVIKSVNETSVIKVNIFHVRNDDSTIDDNRSDDSFVDVKAKSKKRKGVKTRKKSAVNKSKLPPFECKGCNETYETREELYNHRKNVKHPELRNFNCSICKKSFTKSKLNQHMRSHTKEKPYKCKICPQKFSIGSNLRRHVMTHTGERPHVCEICGKGFIQSTTLHVHLKKHTTGVSSDSLDYTSTELPIKCEVCGRGFKREGRYKIHLTKHFPEDAKSQKENKSTPKHNRTTGNYSCGICNRGFKNKYLLKAHGSTHREKSYLCSDCGKVFATKAALQSHLKVHTGEKPHSCMVCKKSFAHVGSFEAHILIHSGEKPYQCPICNKSFTQLTHLKYHKRVHSGERPYGCEYCGKKFALKGNLTVHIRTHTGETPHLCPICGKGFYDSSSMKKHYKIHGDVSDVTNNIKVVREESEDRFDKSEERILTFDNL
ncbi:zinc finger protein [Holotrichia oblita]|uniref:Zinc finger protein n=1 Tax=Holotrichia oblita TaxID=644536 RepID=A0ACB9T172_HOLOL|nr:zinc finger protein [Holotrichia oblita]